MAYTKQTWTNGSIGATPLNATRLNHMEDGIAAAFSPTLDPTAWDGLGDYTEALNDGDVTVPDNTLTAVTLDPAPFTVGTSTEVAAGGGIQLNETGLYLCKWEVDWPGTNTDGTRGVLVSANALQLGMYGKIVRSFLPASYFAVSNPEMDSSPNYTYDSRVFWFFKDPDVVEEAVVSMDLWQDSGVSLDVGYADLYIQRIG